MVQGKYKALVGLVLSGILGACGSDGGSSTPDAAVAPPAVDANSTGVLSSAEVFDESIIKTFELTMSDEDWQFLQDNARLEQYVSGTVRYQGEHQVDNVGIRFKGSVGSLLTCFNGNGEQTCDKLSMKLRFNEYVPGQRFAGLKRINLHSMESDPSKMHDAIGYRLFREAGLLAPRTSYTRVVVNGESLGLFIAVEAIDGIFTDKFPDGGGGNLYKEVWPEHDDAASYLAALKTNEDDNPSADKMLRFAADLAAASDDDFVATLEQWTDTEWLVNYMAVARLIDHWDGIVGWYCPDGVTCFNHNYYWYESSSEDKLWLVPWDLDHTFEEPSPIRTFFGMPDWDEVDAGCDLVPIFLNIEGRPPACDPFINRFARLLFDEYQAASMQLIEGSFSQPAIEARIDELAALIRDEVEADATSTQSLAEWEQAVAALKESARAKREHVLSKFQ